jgi:myo-inositol catabolism protein IolC
MISFREYLEESYKKKYESAPQEVKDVADHMAMLKKQPTDTLKRLAAQASRVHSGTSKADHISILMRSKFGAKKLEAHDKHFFGEEVSHVDGKVEKLS